MGVLKHQTSQRLQTLAVRAIVGRARGCLLRLDDRAASAEHASIFWAGERWEVRDLGSRNGTYVGGQRVGPGERVPLQEGAELLFGGDAERWVLIDALPPVASARRRDAGEVRIAEDGLLALPSGDEPLVSLFEDDAGRWFVEADGAARPAVDREVVAAGGAWLLSIPPLSPSGVVSTTRTLDSPAMLLSTVTLRFEVSRDEEYVELSIVQGDEIRLLGARVHHDLLLALARARIESRDDRSLSPAERGWLYVDDVVAMLKTDPARLCVSVFRARQQLAAAGVIDAGVLIERRATTRQIRLGTDRVEVRML